MQMFVWKWTNEVGHYQRWCIFNFYPKIRYINPIMEVYFCKGDKISGVIFMFDPSSKGRQKNCPYLLSEQFFQSYCEDDGTKNENSFWDFIAFMISCWNRWEARWGCKFFCIGLKISVCLRSCLLIGCSILIFGKWKVGRRTQCGEIIFGGNFPKFSRDGFVLIFIQLQ